MKSLVSVTGSLRLSSHGTPLAFEIGVMMLKGRLGIFQFGGMIRPDNSLSGAAALSGPELN